MSENNSIAIREEFGIAISDALDLQIELARKWGLPISVLCHRKFVKKDGEYVLTKRAKVIDVFAAINGETQYPTRDAVTDLPSRRFYRKRGDKGYHDEDRIVCPCTVEPGEIENW